MTERLHGIMKDYSDGMKETTVIIPVFNEERYIQKCLDSLVSQTYPADKYELLIYDGGSTDNTISIINRYSDLLPIKLIENKDKLAAYALNAGIKRARGEYIIRLDAHARYATTYLEKCIYYLKTIDAENVGGIAITKGEGFIGTANAEILSSVFGVGNSNFRTNSASGYVDTVPFGAFKRYVFDKIGLFDIDLPRSEDNDINSRIRKAGYKVYLASDIQFEYYCRDTIKGLLSQGIKNGNALFLTLRKNPTAMSLRHFVPFVFALSLIIMPLLALKNTIFKWLFVTEIGLYGLLDIYFSFSKNSLSSSIYKFVMYPLFHITYGIGSIIGLFGIKLY